MHVWRRTWSVGPIGARQARSWLRRQRTSGWSSPSGWSTNWGIPIIQTCFGSFQTKRTSARIRCTTARTITGLPRKTGTCPGWWKQSFRLWLWSLVWFQVRAISCHLTSSKSAWRSTLKCTWMCWRVWWSPGAIRWPVANPGCGSRTRHRPTSPKRPRLGFRRSATTLYHSLTGPLPPPTWTRWTTSFDHTSRISPTWPPTTPKPAWSP